MNDWSSFKHGRPVALLIDWHIENPTKVIRSWHVSEWSERGWWITNDQGGDYLEPHGVIVKIIDLPTD